MRHLRIVVGLSTALALTTPALAEDDWVIESQQEMMSIVPHGLRIEIDPSMAEVLPIPEDPTSHSGSHILFVNRCVGGETYSPGSEDSRTNRSSILNGTRTLSAYAFGDASWEELMGHVREIMAPFGIAVTDEDPGSVPHHEAVACGSSFFGGGVLGVAPFSCGVIENSVTFTFANDHGNNPRRIAHTIAQEAAHAWGLDHEYDCKSVMTYLSGCGDKRYWDEYLNCAGVQDGSWVAQSCACGGTTQNSHAHIRMIFGGPLDPTPPTVEITEPTNNAQVDPGFVVRANLSDPEGIQSAALYVDGSRVLELTLPPFVFNAPSDLSDGSHQVEVRAVDGLGSSGSDTIYVIIGEPCESDSDCEDGEACVDGRCVLGPGSPGGLGETCESGANCASGLCGQSGDDHLCTESCSPDLDGCPGGFECLSSGAGGGVCWPGGGSGGGCSVSVGGGESGAPATLVLLMLCALAIVVASRRRR